jgi:hypothetical protein
MLGSTTDADASDPVWVVGKIGGALQFDGAGTAPDDWVTIPGNSSLDIGTGDFTYALWFKGPEEGSWRWIMNQNGDGWSKNALFITTSGGGTRISMTDASDGWFKDVGSRVSIPAASDAWYHVALTRSGSSVRFYLNGAQEGSVGTSGASIGATRPILLGRGPGTSDGFKGLIDDVGFWRGQALDARQIAAIAGLGDFGGVNLASTEVDNVLAISARGQTAVAGGQIWRYADLFPAVQGGGTLKTGMHYTGVNGAQYIVLDNPGGASYRGVTNAANPYLVAHWKFDDGSGQTAADSSFGIHGTLGSSTGSDVNDPTWAQGKIGGALQFTGASAGTGDWVNCGTNSALSPGTGNFTYSLWFKGPTDANGWRWLLAENGGTTEGLFITTQGGTNVRVSMGKWFTDVFGVQNAGFSLGQTIRGDTWYHLAIARSGNPDDMNNMRLYWNGVLRATGTSNALIGIANPLYIGRGPSANDVFNGLIDDVGLWQEALDGRRIAAIAGLGDFVGSDLASSEIDDILALSTLGETASAGGRAWAYTNTFPAILGGGTLVAGLHYTGVDGARYIIISGEAGSGFAGVAELPEPASIALLILGSAIGLIVCRRSRSRYAWR